MRRIAGVIVVLAFVSHAHAAHAQTPSPRGWLDVNFGLAAAAEKRFDARTSIIIDEEPADFSAAYNLPRGASFDVGGGVMITPVVGVGLSVSGTAHEDPAALRIRIPHPFFFNAFASDESDTEGRLQRAEGGVHIQVMAVAYDQGGVRVRVFGGPSRLRLEQELVEDIRYNQVFGLFNPSNTVRITEYDARTVDGSGWGFHAGADVSWFFSRVAGIGGFVRISRATVEVEDPLDEVSFKVKAGGVQTGAGLRLRF
jgi:hypothetical protein